MRILSRRTALVEGLALVSSTALVPNFLARTAIADTKRRSSEKITVAILLTGGPDGLSLVPPFAHDAYHRLRPTTGVPSKSVLKLNDEIGFHPRLKGFKNLYDQGLQTTILGTGYPNFNLSHFESRDYWEAANPKDQSGKAGATGWLGRYLDYAYGSSTNPLLNIAVGPGRFPLLLTGKKHPGIGLEAPDTFQFRGDTSLRGQETYRRLNELAGTYCSPDYPFIQQTAVNANLASDKITDLVTRYRTPITFPDTLFGSSVRTIAGMINGGLPTRVYYVAQGIAVFGGYDTHADQIRRLDLLLSELNDSVTALYKDLERCGNADRVLTFTFSEFGRRVAENYSGGTDHGLAQPMFLFGKGVKPGVHGTHPSLTDLDDRGNLKMQIDFRRVYAAILERWLGVPSEPILGARYEPLDCLTS